MSDLGPLYERAAKIVHRLDRVAGDLGCLETYLYGDQRKELAAALDEIEKRIEAIEKITEE
jgi:hypothetical protein